MPTNQSVTLVKGTVPNGTCFDSVSALYNTFVDLTTAYVDGDYSLFNFGDSEPSASDRDKPWIRTVAGKFDRLYVFFDGGWLAQHPVPVGGASGERRMFVGAVADIDTYDGGTAGAVTETSGPFWVRDTEFDAKFPVGIGSTANGTAITEANRTGGADEVELTEANLPPHTHSLRYATRSYRSGSADIGEGKFSSGGNTADGMVIAGGGQLSAPHNNLPPYYGVYFIKRTGRKYYKV